MIKTLSIYAILQVFVVIAFAQKGTSQEITGKAKDSLLNKLSNDISIANMIDDRSVEKACKCVKKIKRKDKNQIEVNDAISECIEKELSEIEMAISMIIGMQKSMKDTSKNKTIYVGKLDKGAKSEAYFAFESKLIEQCPEVRKLVAVDDKATAYSYSLDKKAQKYYDDGTALMNKQKYEKAIEKLEKAVEIDPEFAYAYDHLGICYRRLDDLDKAEENYKKSLAIDSTGSLPLSNLGVVYEMKKNYDAAINIYARLTRVQPKNPEGFFGAGRILALYKKDYEIALDYVCKAFKIYIKEGSPYRSDAEQMIGYIFKEMKNEKKEEAFYKVMKEHDIDVNNK